MPVPVPGDEGTGISQLPKLQKSIANSAKVRYVQLRKEQLSQGVLSAMLRSLGRLLVEQVCIQNAYRL